MAKGGCIGKFPQNIVTNQRLPLRVVIDECLNMSLQEIGGNRHFKSSNATASFENTVKIDLHLHVVLLAPSIMPRILLIIGKLLNLFILARMPFQF
jgi:hypothetical protein